MVILTRTNFQTNFYTYTSLSDKYYEKEICIYKWWEFKKGHGVAFLLWPLKIFKLRVQRFHEQPLKVKTSIFSPYCKSGGGGGGEGLIEVAALSFQLLPALYSASNSPINNSYWVFHIPYLYIQSQRMLYFCQSGFLRQPVQTQWENYAYVYFNQQCIKERLVQNMPISKFLRLLQLVNTQHLWPKITRGTERNNIFIHQKTKRSKILQNMFRWIIVWAVYSIICSNPYMIH